MKRLRTHAFWVAALAMGLVVLLRLAAHACPADPSWIAGLSDEVDLDEVIQHVLDRHRRRARGAGDQARRPPRFLRLVAADTADGPAAAARSALPTRAPPVRPAPSI